MTCQGAPIAIDIADQLPGVQYPSPTQADLDETVRQVEALDRRIVARKADVRDREALRAAVDAGVAELGRLDIVSANAGICIIADWKDTTEQIFDDTIATNLKGVWNTITLTAPHLIAGGGGSMILTSSVAGIKGLPFLTAYVTAKHGVVGLMRAFATELAEHHIRVNTLHPTGVDTPMGLMEPNPFGPLLAAHPQLGPMLGNLYPVQVTDAVDQSNAVLFLASDESRYITSVELPVDAGATQY